jgi:hypothetical protein
MDGPRRRQAGLAVNAAGVPVDHKGLAFKEGLELPHIEQTGNRNAVKVGEQIQVFIKGDDVCPKEQAHLVDLAVDLVVDVIALEDAEPVVPGYDVLQCFAQAGRRVPEELRLAFRKVIPYNPGQCDAQEREADD